MSRELRAFYLSLTIPVILASAGCLADKGVAPEQPNFELPSSVTLQKVVTPNSVKYSDKGAKPGNKKGAFFEASAVALLNKQAVTRLSVTSGKFEDPASQVGVITRVVVKATGPDGKVLFNRNETALSGGPQFVKDYAGLARDTRLDVTVTIRNADNTKSEPILVTTLVKLPPDIATSPIEAPAGAMANTPVTISVTVAEMNGDMGGRGDCVLYVDGVEADRANGIWVDAGDAVTCAFTQSFAEVVWEHDQRKIDKTHSLKVQISGVLPSDYDGTNNTVMSEIVVTQILPDPVPVPQAQFSYNAFAKQIQDSTNNATSQWWQSADGLLRSEYSDLYIEVKKTQSVQFYGTLPIVATFPLTRLEVVQSTGGRTLHNGVYDNVEASYSNQTATELQTCASADAPSAAGRVTWYVCTLVPVPGSSDMPMTTVQYDRYAGQVTYHSETYSAWWDNGVGDVYTTNDNGGSGDPEWVPFGDTYSFSVKLTDGVTLYSAEPVVQLLGETNNLSTPQQCLPGSDETASWDYCSTSGHVIETLSGTVNVLQ